MGATRYMSLNNISSLTNMFSMNLFIPYIPNLFLIRQTGGYSLVFAMYMNLKHNVSNSKGSLI